MIQISPLLCIGLPDEDIQERKKFIAECNQRRLKHMQENGMEIDEYSDYLWEGFKIWKKCLR
ncbi:MAG: hypothetical protein DRN27_05830 [Thermoplasmata archaeon]|nr:MAG: hypothetical protein DRN27_05830 [Thermoplasmata archaeon]